MNTMISIGCERIFASAAPQATAGALAVVQATVEKSATAVYAPKANAEQALAAGWFAPQHRLRRATTAAAAVTKRSVEWGSS